MTVRSRLAISPFGRRPLVAALAMVPMLAGGAASLARLAGDGAPSAQPAGPAVGSAGGSALGSAVGQDRFDAVASVGELRDLEREIVEVAARVRPSVVAVRGGSGASGTAVVIGEDGLLATCGHVGRRAGRPITAILADGTELKGRTLGQAFDGAIDCGLIQLDTEGRTLPAVPMGTTSGLEPGDWVVALGYTHGLGDTVRPSLVRAGRVLHVNDKELFFDAPIDAGDSGGPSFNLRGEIVGLNSRCGTESWQNVATRIDLLKERMEELRSPEGGATSPPQGEPNGEPHGEPNREPDGDEAESPRRRSPRFPTGPEAGRLAVERGVPLAAVVAELRRSMVRVRSGEDAVAWALVVGSRGEAITKASQLVEGMPLSFERDDGTRIAAVELARDTAADVALLRAAESVSDAELAALAPVTLAADHVVRPGAVVLTPRGRDEDVGLGFAAIEERESEVDRLDGAYLGVQTRPAREEELERAGADKAVTIVRVFPGTAAAKAGLRPGEMLLALNDTDVGTPVELRGLLREIAVGESVRLKRVQGKAASELTVVLGRRESARDGLRRGNTTTPISRRSSGFGALLPHDTVTLPSEMGTPLVDLDGRVVGMNIARFDRTATHAIHAARLREIVQELRAASSKAP